MPKSPKLKDRDLSILFKNVFYTLHDSDLEKLGAIKSIFLAMNISSYWQCNNTYIPILILYIGTKKKLRFDYKELSLETIYQCLYLSAKILNPSFDTSVLLYKKCIDGSVQ